MLLKAMMLLSGRSGMLLNNPHLLSSVVSVPDYSLQYFCGGIFVGIIFICDASR